MLRLLGGGGVAMQVRTRTALVTLVLNTVLTALKFVAFAFTGSLAILAEAWHSFGDIATSAAALLSVWRQARAAQGAEAETTELPAVEVSGGHAAHDAPDWPGPSGGSDGDTDPGDSTQGPPTPPGSRRLHVPLRWIRMVFRPLARLARGVWRLQPEQKAALLIGLVLAGIGIALLRKVLGAEATEVARPLVAGIAFLVFSLASYAVSRFELGVGRAEGSPALVADGMHARADAVATFLTGCSLIVYHFGVDVDRPVAGLLGLIILSFAAETLVNLVFGAVRGEGRYALRVHSVDLLAAAADPRTVAHGYRRARARLDRGGAVSRALGGVLRASPWAVGVGAVLAYGSTALYTVGPHQQAVVERFGRVLDASQPAGPGLHGKLPWPIDRVYRAPSQRVRHLAVGNQARDVSVPLIWTRQHGTDEVYISGDNNFFYPYIVIHWRVADVHAFRYGAVDPERLLEDLALAEMTRRFAGLDFYRIALDGREALDREMSASLQTALDSMESGIEIVDVVLKDIHPPRDVARSFEGVVAAMQDHETYVDVAEGYRNARIPEARADAVRQVAEAHGYVAENKTRSEGDATRFRAREEAFATSRAVTRDRMYLDAMARVLTGRRKVLVCPACGQPDIWLDGTVSVPPKPRRSGETRGAGGRQGGTRR